MGDLVGAGLAPAQFSEVFTNKLNFNTMNFKITDEVKKCLKE
jgi:hypothetical protein